MMSSALVISEAVHQSENRLWDSIPAIAVIDHDNSIEGFLHQFVLETNGKNFFELTDEQQERFETAHRFNPGFLQEVMDFPQVRSVEYLGITHLFSSNYSRFGNEHGLINSDGATSFFTTGISAKDFSLIREGVIELTAGRNFTDEELASGKNVMIVSEELAFHNNWNVLDIITLNNSVYYLPGEELETHPFGAPLPLYWTESHQFQIIGLFKARPANTGASDIDYAVNLEILNRILIPIEKFRTLRFDNWSNDPHQTPFLESGGLDRLSMQQTAFLLHSSREMRSFIEEVTPSLPAAFRIREVSTFGSMIETLDIFQNFSSWILLGSNLAGFLLLGFLVLLFLNDRKHEIGIYLALGDKKLKVLAQFVMEIIPIALLALTAGFFIGYFLSDHLSVQIIQTELISLHRPNQKFGNHILSNFEVGHMTIEEMMASYQIELSAGTVARYFLFGLSSIIMAVLLPIAYVSNLKLQKIINFKTL